MKIAVLVKQVPDTWGDRKLDVSTGRLDRGASDAIIDEIGERAVEVALQVKDSDKATEVVAISMGPASARDTLLKALAMGADSAIHILDDGLVGADLSLTAKAVAAAIRTGGFDLVVAGNESTDGRGGMLAPMIAEHLGLPHLSSLDEVQVAASGVTGKRVTENGSADVHASLPAVIAITERVAEPRFPNFKGILGAKKKPFAVTSLADLGVAAGGPRAVVLETKERPPRSAGTKIVGSGDAATQLAAYLADARLI